MRHPLRTVLYIHDSDDKDSITQMEYNRLHWLSNRVVKNGGFYIESEHDIESLFNGKLDFAMLEE